jgi:hypothetical protein
MCDLRVVISEGDCKIYPYGDSVGFEFSPIQGVQEGNWMTTLFIAMKRI